MAKSFCLLTELQTLEPTTSTGGWWEYVSYAGAGSATIQSGNTCADPCTSTMPKNPTERLGGASSGCPTCTSCTVITSNPCVTLSAVGIYVFRYSVKCVSECCVPQPNCTSLLTIEITSGPVISISSSSQSCIETLSITKVGAINKNTSSMYMNASITTQVCSSCGGGPPTCGPTTTFTADAGKVANAIVMDLTDCIGAEVCNLKSIGFTAKLANGLLSTSPQFLVSNYFGSCTSGSCIYNGSNDAAVVTFYSCVVSAMLADFNALLGGGFTWELNVTCTAGILLISLTNKNIVASSGDKWIGFLKNAVTDGNGLHPANFINWRDAGNCNATNPPTNTTPRTINYPNTVTFTGTFFGVSCLVIGGTTFSIGFSDIVSVLSSDAFTLAGNAVSVWVLGAYSIPGYAPVSLAGNPLTWAKTCIANVLTANVTGCGSPTYLWSNGATTQTTSYPHNPAGPTSCASVKVCCGTCCNCAHVCLMGTMPYVSGTYTGNCSTGCSNNSTCP